MQNPRSEKGETLTWIFIYYFLFSCLNQFVCAYKLTLSNCCMSAMTILHLFVAVCATASFIPLARVFQVCKRIWLGHHDERTASVPDFREPQKVKEFLQDKYEKKRW